MDKISQPAQYLEWPGFILVAIGALFHALHVVNVKNMQNRGLPSDVITTLFALLSGVLFFVTSFLFNPPNIWSIFNPQIGIFWPLFATCALNVVVQFANVRAQEYADPAMVSAVGGFQPFISLLPAWLILGETPNEIGYVGLVLIAVGIYVTSLSQKIGDPAKVPAWGKTAEGELRWTAPLASLFTNRGVQLAFLATVAGAISVNFDKKAAMLSSYLFAPGVILVFVGIVGVIKTKRVLWEKLERKHLGWILLAALLYFALNVFYWCAFRYGLAIYISSLKRLHTIFVLPLSYFFLKSAVTKDKKYWVGIALFIAGILFFTVP